MATTTFYQALVADQWTEIALGSGFKEVVLQISSIQPAVIAVATGEPALDSPAVVVLWGEDRSLSVPLSSGDKLYARGREAASAVRGWKVSV